MTHIHSRKHGKLLVWVILPLLSLSLVGSAWGLVVAHSRTVDLEGGIRSLGAAIERTEGDSSQLKERILDSSRSGYAEATAQGFQLVKEQRPVYFETNGLWDEVASQY